MSKCVIEGVKVQDETPLEKNSQNNKTINQTNIYTNKEINNSNNKKTEIADDKPKKDNINDKLNIKKHEITNEIDKVTDSIFYIQRFFNYCPRHEDYLKSFKKKVFNSQNKELEFKKEKDSFCTNIPDNIYGALMSSKRIEKEKYNFNDNDKSFVNIRDYELYQYKYGSRCLNIIRVKDIEEKIEVKLSNEEKEILHKIIENERYFDLFIKELEKQYFENVLVYSEEDVENNEKYDNNLQYNYDSKYKHLYINY